MSAALAVMAAGFFEVHRKDLPVVEQRLSGKIFPVSSMLCFHLAPQYILLGVAEALVTPTCKQNVLLHFWGGGQFGKKKSTDPHIRMTSVWTEHVRVPVIRILTPGVFPRLFRAGSFITCVEESLICRPRGYRLLNNTVLSEIRGDLQFAHPSWGFFMPCILIKEPDGAPVATLPKCVTSSKDQTLETRRIEDFSPFGN